MSSTSLHPLQKNNRNNNKKKPPQDDNDNNEDNHVRRLLREKASLERALAALCRQHRLAARERRGRRARYAHLVAKTELLGRVKKRNEIELYWATLSGTSPTRIATARAALRQTNTTHHETQLAAADRLHALVAALRAEQALLAAARARHARLVRVQEEIHRRRPCGVFLCEHCCRGRGRFSLRRKGGDGDGGGEDGDGDIDGEKRFERMLRGGGRRRRMFAWGFWMGKKKGDVGRRDDDGGVVVEEDDDVFGLEGGGDEHGSGGGGVLAKVKRAFAGLRLRG